MATVEYVAATTRLVYSSFDHFMHPYNCYYCPHRHVAVPTPVHAPPLAPIAAHPKRPAPITTMVQAHASTTTALSILRPTVSVFLITQ